MTALPVLLKAGNGIAIAFDEYGREGIEFYRKPFETDPENLKRRTRALLAIAGSRRLSG